MYLSDRSEKNGKNDFIRDQAHLPVCTYTDECPNIVSVLYKSSNFF